MSTYDEIKEITSAYKKQDNGFVGHDLHLLAHLSGTRVRLYGDSMPNCGPLLFINYNRQRYTTGCEVNFTYHIAGVSGYVPSYVNGLRFNNISYTGLEGEYTGVLTIPADCREYKQHLYNNHALIRGITSASLSDPTQEVKIYSLADDGSRLLYAINDEVNRGMVDILERAVWVSPPKCLLCKGVGTYQGEICPDCQGYKYVGRNAEKYLLTQRGADIGIKLETETETSMQYRAWAKKWWLIPTVDEIKRYVSHFLNIESGYIRVIEHRDPELYFTVRVPLASFGDGELVNIGDILSPDLNAIKSFVEEVEPAGTNAVFEGYYLFTDPSAISGVRDNISFGSCGWNSSSFGGSFGSIGFYNLTGYYGIITGEVKPGTGFYQYLTEEDVVEIYTYDRFFTQSGTVYN